jgi:putative chitinase
MNIDRDQLLRIMPAAGPYVETYLAPLNAAMAENGIVTPLDVVAFLANVAVESGQLSTTSENLNYSAEGLAATWPARFADLKVGPRAPNALARSLAHQPERIANLVYANRMGNGDVASGDGWAHRGAGLLELTGKAMQLAAAHHFGVDPALIGDWLRSPSGAARSAAWYYASRGCSVYANKRDFDGVCDVVNLGRKTAALGDSIGYVARQGAYGRGRQVFGV